LGFTQVGRDIIAGGTASDVLAYLGVPNLLNGKQDADNTLTALARLAGAANKLPYFSGPDVMSMTDFSDIGRAIIAASTKSSVLSYLELTTLGQALVKGGTASDILRTLGFNNGNGWYRIGEILIQFGHIPFAATSVPVTFPIPFPVVIDQIIVSDAGYASGNTWGATDRTQLGFTAQTNSTGQGGQYFAIGR
ncbi:gp53-like domain-containing protein, partial [Citrobacter freundii]